MMKLYLLIICAALLGCSDPVYANTVIKADSVVKVYDGDTFNVNIAGCPDVLCRSVPVRISGIDAPEMRGKCKQEKAGALVARNYLSGKVSKAQYIELHNVTRDKYFRINADVFADGVNVGQDMISKGLVRPYTGGKRSGWCANNTS